MYKPLFTPSRYKAFFGGRGSGKSHSFATALVLKAAEAPLRILCSREIQRSIKDSVKRLVDDKIAACGLGGFYTSTETEIRGKNGSLFIFAGLRSNVESIKSMEAIDIGWVEEANYVSQKSLDLLIPTIRAENSEIWFSWNPENEVDPVDMMFRGRTPPPNSIIQQVSWRDNPWFSGVLIQERDFDRTTNIEKYNYVWEGGYRMTQEGAYYGKQIAKAISEGRITHVPYDSHAPVYTAFDLGISDALSIWFCQLVGKELHIIDFLESTGQPIEWYARELKNKPYIYADLILPHDARARSLGTGKSIEEILRGFGFSTTICPMIPIKDGIDNVRAILEQCWFDSENCHEGLKHLRAYRENYDDKLRISRGPLHDQHSHAADAMRYLAVGLATPEPEDRKLEAAQNKYLDSLKSNDNVKTYSNSMFDKYFE